MAPAEAASVDETNESDKACRYLAKRQPGGLASGTTAT
jgi:hypothetical protein